MINNKKRGKDYKGSYNYYNRRDKAHLQEEDLWAKLLRQMFTHLYKHNILRHYLNHKDQMNPMIYLYRLNNNQVKLLILDLYLQLNNHNKINIKEVKLILNNQIILQRRVKICLLNLTSLYLTFILLNPHK